jgi:hypothetical protein
VCVCVYVRMCMCVCVYVCMYVCMYGVRDIEVLCGCIALCMIILSSIGECRYVYMYVCMYVCMYVWCEGYRSPLRLHSAMYYYSL